MTVFAPSTATRKAPGKAMRRTTSIWTVLNYAILIFVAAIYISPFLMQISSSFKSEAESTSNALGLPQSWTVLAYKTLFLNSNFPLWIVNSFVVTIFVTAGRVFFNSLAGYALARLHFTGRQTVYAILIGIMAVPGVVLLIPKFLVIRQLGIYNSYTGMILPLLVDAAGVFIMKNFFESIPVAVEEAARIDGAGVFRTFWSVVLPMARPALVTIVILSFQGSWNELSHFIVSTNDPNLVTLTKGVAQLASGQLSAGNQFPIKLAAAGLMTIPVGVMFFLFQRQIMNVSGGAVKE